MSNMIELHRGFRLGGSDIDDFIEAVTAMEAATKVVDVSSDRIGLAAVVSSHYEATAIAMTSTSRDTLEDCAKTIQSRFSKCESENKLTIYSCEPGSKFSLKALDMESFTSKPGVNRQLADELRYGSKMVMMIAGKSYVVSDLASSTLNNRAKIGGDAKNGPSVGRIVDLAMSFHHTNTQNLRMITRSNQQASIIIAAHSEKYAYVPQTILCDIYNKIAQDFGRTECLQWEVTHEITHCYLGFPEIAKEFADTYGLPNTIVPGLYLSTSDSGDGSLTIRGIWDINGRRAGGPCLKRNHRGDVDVEKFVEMAWKKIFAEYNSIPTRLADLLTINVDDPIATLRRVFHQIGITKSCNLGKKTSKALFTALVDEFDKTAKYTAYDIAMAIASVPERCIGMHHSVIEKLENLVRDAIFADYTHTKNVKEDDTFFLA